MKKPLFWYCIIGPVEAADIPMGGDLPPRMAARRAVLESTGADPICSSGWIDEGEVRSMEVAAMKWYKKKHKIGD